MSARRTLALGLAWGAGLLGLGACADRGAGTPPSPALRARVPDLPHADMEPRVSRSLREAEAQVLAQPDSAQAWEELGLRLDAHGLRAEARAALETALELEPGRFVAAYDLAFVLGVLGEDPSLVVAAHDRALALRPSHGAGHVRRADALARCGREEEARESLERALILEPLDDRARARLGALLLDLGEPEAGRALLLEVVERHPEDGPTLSALARCAGLLGDDAGASAWEARAAQHPTESIPWIDPVRHAVQERAMSSWALFQRSRSAAAAGDRERAAELLGQALEAQPNAYHGRAERARLLLALGRGEEARSELERVLAQVPEHVLALQLRGQWHCEGERFQQALDDLEHAARVGPLEPESLVAWGFALARLGRHTEGALRLDEALALQPGNHDLRWRRALVLELGGELEAALAAYDDAASLFPAHPLADRRRSLAERLGR